MANRDVHLSVAPREIRGVVGENGAGKTTLMAIASGLYRPDAGAVVVGGAEHRFRSPLDAIAVGIDMVHQHFMLVPTLTVAENVVLGVHGSDPWLRLREVRKEVAELGERYGLFVDPDRPVSTISPSQQQRVEILTALYRGSRILILDEPTSVLTPHEIDNLFLTMRELAAEGRSVIFISHKLDEILAVCDRISVMRGGEMVATLERAEADVRQLALLMVGHELKSERRARGGAAGEPLLAVGELRVEGDRGTVPVADVTLSVGAGEILGLAGVEGNGQHELIEAIVGLRRPVSGTLELHGHDVTALGAAARIELGLAYVPEDPRHNALLLPFSLVWNTGLRHRSPRGRRRFVVDFRRLRELTEEAIAAFDIRSAGPATPAGHLSGGNQQKAVLARELGLRPDVLVVVNPTVGLDVGAAEYVHEALCAERDRGVAILLASTDLDEVEVLSDRIAVMYRGRVAGVLAAAAADRGRLGLLMAGVRPDEQGAAVRAG